MPTLSWIGKEAVENHHKRVPFRLLKRNNKLSVGKSDSGNLVVHGDNLESLKALLPYYARQVKCIYIDPPYNTGSEDWIYNDNVSSPEIKKWLGEVVGKEGEDLSRHDKWLCMMYPRIALLKDFLRDDGFMCCHIDDSESSYFRVILDEIFGRQNYLVTLYIQVRYPSKTLTQDMDFHKEIECIHIYRKKYGATPNLPRREKSFDKFKYYIVEKGKGKETVLGNKKVVMFKKDDYDINKGEGSEKGLKEIWASGAILDGNSSGRFFRDYLMGRVNEDGLGVLYKVYGIGNDRYDYRYFTGPKREGASKGKYFQGVPVKLLNNDSKSQTVPIENFYNLAGGFGNCRLEGGVDFRSGKKPEVLLKIIVEYFSSKNDIVMDSFAGSGSTGAVAHKLKRRWIMVEMGEHAVSHIVPRMNLVISGNDKSGITESCNWKGGGGFSYCELGQNLFNADGQIKNEVSYNELARHIYFCETGEPLKKTTRNNSPLLGIHKGNAIYLLYNGILKDKKVDGGNVLTSGILAKLPEFDGKRVIYGTACRFSDKRLRSENIIFKQTPYEIRIS